MVEPTEVWMVHLGPATKPAEIRGTLTLGEEGSSSSERKTGATRLRLHDDPRAKRIRGSPVLLVDWQREEKRKTAFYFSQPPPLEPLPGSASTLDPSRTARAVHTTTPTKRQVARMNLGYLRSTSVSKKKTVQAWVDAVNERARGR